MAEIPRKILEERKGYSTFPQKYHAAKKAVDAYMCMLVEMINNMEDSETIEFREPTLSLPTVLNKKNVKESGSSKSTKPLKEYLFETWKFLGFVLPIKVLKKSISDLEKSPIYKRIDAEKVMKNYNEFQRLVDEKRPHIKRDFKINAILEFLEEKIKIK